LSAYIEVDQSFSAMIDRLKFYSVDTSSTKNPNTLACRIKLSSERVINVWNDMPADTVDFTSLTNFKKSSMRVDVTAHLKCFP